MTPKLFSALTALAFSAPAVLISSTITPAFAATVGLYQTTNNNAGFTDLNDSVSVNYTDVGGTGLRFDISNIGPQIFSVTDVYFGRMREFSEALSFASIDNGDDGVQYSQGARPNNPGGGIKWDAAFASDPDGPSGFLKNGIDTGELLSIAFDYKDGYSFADIKNGFASDSLTFAMHVQSVGGDGGGSDWIASQADITSVPEPLTLLGTAAAIGIGAGLKKKARKSDA